MNRALLYVSAAALWASAAVAQERAPAPRPSPMLVASAGGDLGGDAGSMLFGAVPMPSHTVSEIASGAVPQSATRDIVVSAMPPPPTTVELETKTYGTVTLDHAAHLSRRVSCKLCHGPGPVGKIGHFSAKVAHDACRGCHQEIAKGPIDCRGCHVQKPETEVAKAETEAASAAAAATSTGPEKAAAGTAVPPSEAAAAAAVAAATEFSDVHAELSSPLAYRRTALVGTSVLAGDGKAPAPGLSATVRMLEGGYVFSNTLDVGAGGRMLGLIGGGVVLPVRNRWAVHVLGVGGFDAMSAVLLPALGARASLEWRAGQRWIQGVDVSLTTVADLGQHEGAAGQKVGGVIGALAVSAGFDMRSSK